MVNSKNNDKDHTETTNGHVDNNINPFDIIDSLYEQFVGERILEASTCHVAKLAILAELNSDYPVQDQVVCISLAPPARGGLTTALVDVVV